MRHLVRATVYCYLTGALVAGGFALAALVRPSPVAGHKFHQGGEPQTNWDGQWYQKIAEDGYDFRRDECSSAAFFPAYPLAGRLVARATGCDADVALLAVSNLLFLASAWLILRYAELRFGDADGRVGGLAVVALATLPVSLFFRVNYSESLFLFVLTAFLYGAERRWHPAALAAVVGLATATRPVGVALVPPLALHVWWSAPGGRLARAARVAAVLPLSVWGLAAFMAYLGSRFGDPLAFLGAQDAWNQMRGSSPAARALSLLTLEPVWSFLLPSSPAYWYNNEYHHSFLFGMRPWNSAAFLGASALVAYGAARRWLNPVEAVTAALLLAVPYATNGYATHMNSMARYASVVVPAYLVLARLLARLESATVAALAAVSGFFLGAFSALFATWHVII